MLGISVWAFVDLLKMSMEDTTEEVTTVGLIFFTTEIHALKQVSRSLSGRLCDF